MMLPYTGITGFMDQAEVSAVLDAMPEDSERADIAKAVSNRMMMIGVLASSETIEGIQNSKPRRYPKPEKMGSIFQPHPRALNLIHFNTKKREFLFEQMMRARALAGEYCHGFQLNIAWPGTDLLMRVLGEMPKSTIIVLQVGVRAFEMIGNSPKKLADKVASEYGGLIHYVLLDASGGTGRSLDTCFLRPYLYALAAKRLPIGLGVAGGLSADSLDLVAPLADEFPELCIDAEGKLRDENDDLNVSAAISYRTRADALFDQRS